MTERRAVVVVPAAEPARARRVDARRNLEAIVESARRLLPEQPSVSMQEIAAEAGVHRATVHRHFASRDDLVTAVRMRAMEDSIAACNRVLADPPARAADVLEQVTAAMLASADTYRLYRFTTWFDEHTEIPAREMAAAVIPLLASGQREGDVRADIEPERLLVAWGGLVSATLPQIADKKMTVAGAAGYIRTLLAGTR
jgi:TetR/AcrR family transcriptional repressor of mexCD-oprJ operon